jgi:HrpA-like RNA helicase
MAMTIPDVDVVLDCGIGRFTNDDEVPESFDYLASATSITQREGRAGRAKPGCYLRFLCKAFLRHARDVPLSSDSLMRVVALENFHCQIPVSSCRFSYATPDEISAARLRLTELGLEGSDLETALRKMPLPLHLCSIVLQARSYDVGYEAAAIVAVKASGRWKHKATFTAQEIIASVAQRGRVVQDISRLGKVRTLFRNLCNSLCLHPTRLCTSYTEERLAIAFLQAPERLVWSIGQNGAFLGSPLVHDCTDEYFVAALFSNPSYSDLRCALHLPFSSWVQRMTGIQPPTRTLKKIGDSTFQDFRRSVCQHLREQFLFDVRWWSCRGGAWETTLAEDLAASPKTDNSVMCPNGNRMMLHSQLREPTGAA